MVDRGGPGPGADALRMRRVRRHNRGDHSLCRPEKCPALLAEAAPAEVVPAEASSLEAVTRLFVESLGFAEADPRSLLGEIAARLAAVIDRSANASAARELRVLLAQLAEVPGQPAGVVDEIRVQRAQRRLDALIASMTAGAGLG